MWAVQGDGCNVTNLPATTRKMQVSDLWRAEGKLGRGSYLIWGSSLFAIKYGIDSFIAEVIFHRHWDFLRYLFPGQSLDFLMLSQADRAFFLTIMILAMPFIWAGVVLTIRRLRSAGLPVFLVYLFFVPFVNLLLFILLSGMPPLRISAGEKPRSSPENAGLPPASDPENAGLLPGSDPGSMGLLPDSDPGSAGILPAPNDSIEAASGTPALPGTGPPQLPAPNVIPPLPAWPKPDRSLPKQQQLIVNRNALKRAEMVRTLATTCPPSIALAWLGIFCLQSYGWGLFVGLPFALGMSAAYLYGRQNEKTLGDCIGIGLLATTLLGIGMFFFAWEGMVCLVMASPIVYTLALMGALLGYNVQRNKIRAQDQRLLMTALLLSMPTLMGAEYASRPESELLAVTSTVEIAAPPAVVWHHVIAFPQLEPPTDWIFKLGVAYPIGATINGEGAGAVRKCNFSTGAFIEPIQVWDAPRLLKFGVAAQPPSMREFSWMHEIHPAHLNGYLKVHAGQFDLQPIVDGNGITHTRLVGTTWYQNKMWPAPYWKLWSDDILHRIHLRVLKHIQKNAEHEMSITSSADGDE